jgi:hypothetical protein
MDEGSATANVDDDDTDDIGVPPRDDSTSHSTMKLDADQANQPEEPLASGKGLDVAESSTSQTKSSAVSSVSTVNLRIEDQSQRYEQA